jgi:hypothetical protein
MAAFINETSDVVQPALALGASLAFQALLCSQLVCDPKNTRPNVYILAVGRSGKGKGRGIHVINEILHRVGQVHGFDAFSLCFERASSPEGILKLLSRTGGIAIWTWDETGKTLKEINQGKGGHKTGIIELLMTLYTSSGTIQKPSQRSTNPEPFKIQQPHLILYGASTPRHFMESLGTDALTDGMAGRLFLFEADEEAAKTRYPQRNDVTPSLVDQARWWLEQLPERYAAPLQLPKPLMIPVTQEADDILFSINHELFRPEIKADEIKEALWIRGEEQARKMAIIYTCSKYGRNYRESGIDAEAARWAVDLVVFLINLKISLAKDYTYEGEFDKKQKTFLLFLKNCTFQETIKH